MTGVEFTHGDRLKHDYTGAHVSYVRNGNSYLGTVVANYRDEDGTLWFSVRHFNGEPAPDVPAGLVNVLERAFVCANCGQFIHSGDCLNECHKRGLA